MLATFPNTALADPTIEDRRDARAAALRRAITFMDEHAGDDISAADIAAAANVTIRAIQLAFRRHLDTAPMGYLRRVRLEHARRELLSADPARDTVKAVAARRGFARPDRFTASYRDLFGVLPDQTLRDS
jgi:transcriptional regulator GlxA family with amidase domain